MARLIKVKVAKRIYQMGPEEFKGLLKVASEQVPFGIYAIERKGYAELCNIHCKSITELKQKTRDFRKAGYKVYQNGRA